MKILVVAFAWNESLYVEQMVNYFTKQGCDLNIIDNASTDGTYEKLKSLGVRTRVKDTNNCFDLVTLQRCLLNDLKAVKPDWVIYTGIDTYYIFKDTIRKTIEEADRFGYNMISTQLFNFFNTGEVRGLPMNEHYFHGRFMNRLYTIAKYDDDFKFEADSIIRPNRKTYPAEGLMINYGDCKTSEEREMTFRRRKKAWDNGLDKNYGVHYLAGRDKKWIWNKNTLVDIRETEYWKYVKKLK